MFRAWGVVSMRARSRGRSREERRWRGSEHLETAAVLLATLGRPLTSEALALALELAGGGRIAVVGINRIYGTSFGLQNPGLFPTRREREEQLEIVRRAVQDLVRAGGEADGQVSATRHPEKTIAYLARRREARAIVIDLVRRSWIRGVVEGSPARAVRRRVGPGVDVREVITP